jgi:hypothetical protein
MRLRTRGELDAVVSSLSKQPVQGERNALIKHPWGREGRGAEVWGDGGARSLKSAVAGSSAPLQV